MNLNKSDLQFQILIYRNYKDFGFTSEQVKNMNVKQLKELFDKTRSNK